MSDLFEINDGNWSITVEIYNGKVAVSVTKAWGMQNTIELSPDEAEKLSKEILQLAAVVKQAAE